MRVAIAAVASSAHLSGVTRHAVNLARCLQLQRGVGAIDLLVAEEQYQSFASALSDLDSCKLHIHSLKTGRSALSRNVWFYLTLPGLLKQLKTDVLHYAYPAPLRVSAIKCPAVVTLHDLYPLDIPSNFGYAKVLFNRLILWQCMQAADAVACVSNTTMSRLEAHAPLLAIKKSTTIPNAVVVQSEASIRPESIDAGLPFLLCVAQHRRNKNILLALQVFRNLLAERRVDQGTKLVIVGIAGPETPIIHDFIQRNKLLDSVVLLQGLAEAELGWCYQHAQVLVAPSLCEGFGLPVVEAMLRRCPVVCSDIPAFREVGGSYCDYVRLDDRAEENFASIIAASLERPHLRLPRMDRFRPEIVGAVYVELYTRLLGAHSVVDDPQPIQLLSSFHPGDSHELP